MNDCQILEGSEDDFKEFGPCLAGTKELTRVSEHNASGSPVHHHV